MLAPTPATSTSDLNPEISPARLAANRANAQKSTGPRTPEGKARSRANAYRHGLAGEGVVLPEDQLEVVAAVAAEITDELRPHGPMGRILTHRVAALTVRLDRCSRPRRGDDRVPRSPRRGALPRRPRRRGRPRPRPSPDRACRQRPGLTALLRRDQPADRALGGRRHRAFPRVARRDGPGHALPRRHRRAAAPRPGRVGRPLPPPRREPARPPGRRPGPVSVPPPRPVGRSRGPPPRPVRRRSRPSPTSSSARSPT